MNNWRCCENSLMLVEQEAFMDTDCQPMSSKGQHDELGHVATAVLSVPSVEKKIRLSR
jgi:hypothetical protein